MTSVWKKKKWTHLSVGRCKGYIDLSKSRCFCAHHAKVGFPSWTYSSIGHGILKSWLSEHRIARPGRSDTYFFAPWKWHRCRLYNFYSLIRNYFLLLQVSAWLLQIDCSSDWRSQLVILSGEMKFGSFWRTMSQHSIQSDTYVLKDLKHFEVPVKCIILQPGFCDICLSHQTLYPTLYCFIIKIVFYWKRLGTVQNFL